MAAVISIGNSSYATLNVNVLDRASEFTRAALPVSYESENASDRIERRIRNWTPAEIEEDE
jgi:hypothetical protein